MLANQMNSHYLNQGNLIYSINADQSNILSYYRPIKYTVLPHMYQIYLLYAGQSNKSKTNKDPLQALYSIELMELAIKFV